MSVIAFISAFVWGVLWSLFLQLHPLGRFLVVKRTWITVVIGVGMNLLIALMVLEFHAWVTLVVIFAFSSVGIITRSMLNEFECTRGEINDIRQETVRQECNSAQEIVE